MSNSRNKQPTLTSYAMKNSTSPTHTETLKVLPKALLWILVVATLVVLELPLLARWESWEWGQIRPNVGAVVFLALIWWFVLACRIKLRLDAEGVTYQFWPLPKKRARWEELKGWYVREVSAFGEFGGWGMRYGFNLGWGYVNASDWGLQLVYKEGKRVIISTENPEEVRRWLERYAPAEVIETAER